MDNVSILFETLDETAQMNEPFSSDVLSDIHIDAVITQMLKGREEYELKPYFVHKLPDAEAIKYRIDIMQDIDREQLLEPLHAFSRNMRKVRELERVRNSTQDKEQRWKWHADAAYYYCEGVLQLHEALSSATLQSNGLKRFAASLAELIASDSFTAFSNETFELRTAFDQIRYSLIVENGKMTVSPAEIDKNYCEQLSRVFQVQSEQDEDDFSFRLFSGTLLSGLETNILNIVRKLYPEPFRDSKAFAAKYQHFIHPPLFTFEREVQFYIASLEFFHSLRRQGLPYSYPVMTNQQEIRIRSGYDVALASSQLHTGQTIVVNDVDLSTDERICVVTGPNQGGKTTFVRFIGQILYLSAIGCPAPCQSAELYVFDRLFTHFPAKELAGTDTGQLKEELLRLNVIFNEATADSVVLLNELFATTATLDAYNMGTLTLQTFLTKTVRCFFVTHIVELADAHKQIVSLASTTDRANPAKRTFKIVRKRADGFVYASSLAEKYGLSKFRIEERIRA